jgi:predicted Zn-ribbon and HTH transcriptional regulator
MNKDLLYDFGKLLKKYDPEEIRELTIALKDKKKLNDLIQILESIEKISKALRKEGKAHKMKKKHPSDSSFRGLSNAILNKSDTNHTT